MLAALKLIPGRLWGYLAAGVAVLVAVWRIYSAGQRSAEASGVRDQLKNTGKRNEVDIDVGRLPDGGAADQLRNDWSRD